MPYAYMPRAWSEKREGERSAREPTDGQCSAAQLCSYFAKGVEWDAWYASRDPSARPDSIVGRAEARWRGNVVTSQETKKRLFGSEKVSIERSRLGVVTFQDYSIGWYRVAWKEGDPVQSLVREARYRATPKPLNGDKLYAAHLLYGQPMAEFVEQAIERGQYIGDGESWDIIPGAQASLPGNIPPVMSSVGHCHGHLLYEGYIDERSGRVWGATRGGEIAIRDGDIIQWCDAQFETRDTDEYGGGNVTILNVGESGFTSMVLSAEEFPVALPSDEHTLPPTRLPNLEIAIQSASNREPPRKRLVDFGSMRNGRVWIYRCVGWDYVGLEREPEAVWPPPDPTLFLP